MMLWLIIVYPLGNKFKVIKRIKLKESEQTNIIIHEFGIVFLLLLILACFYSDIISIVPWIIWIPLCGLGLIYLGDYEHGLRLFCINFIFKIVEYILYLLIITYNYSYILQLMFFITLIFENFYVFDNIKETRKLYKAIIQEK
ncbi:hypothetical protein [Methanosphaera sp. WGK6]|uniref:hypothetical protein n=1 Tax=Methanosphaera sp. WGK6 TaxID=1561964 RepID=UPI00117BF6DD|nr:hypothetical protein [Methanosphaera sp. WGK6]